MLLPLLLLWLLLLFGAVAVVVVVGGVVVVVVPLVVVIFRVVVVDVVFDATLLMVVEFFTARVVLVGSLEGAGVAVTSLSSGSSGNVLRSSSNEGNCVSNFSITEFKSALVILSILVWLT